MFVAPVYAQHSLAEYYGHSFGAPAGVQPDYDTSRRLAFLDRVAPDGSTIVEVGSNRPSLFHRRLAERYDRVVRVELNGSVDREFVSLDSVPTAAADVLVHYFVLEHVPQVRAFLRACHRVLRPDGIMVCEVPDIAVYPHDPSALQLYEHTNHFSAGILEQITVQAAFRLVQHSSELCSRPFGFAVAFTRMPTTAARPVGISEFEQNRRFVAEGLEKLRAIFDVFEPMRELLSVFTAENKRVVFWAANELMARFLQWLAQRPEQIAPDIPACVTIVDSNPEKAHFFGKDSVREPAKAVKAIQDAEALFLFTRFYAPDIIHQIQGICGKQFRAAQIHIVDRFGE